MDFVIIIEKILENEHVEDNFDFALPPSPMVHVIFKWTYKQSQYPNLSTLSSTCLTNNPRILWLPGLENQSHFISWEEDLNQIKLQ